MSSAAANDRQRRRQAAERGHRLDEPVERAGKIDRAGQQAEEQRASGRPNDADVAATRQT